MSKRIEWILIIIIPLIFFAILQFSFADFLGYDAYYHVKMAQKMIEGDFIYSNFPWLQFTVLKDNFVDHHFLFHLLLIPFVYFSPIIGAKIAQVIFASLVMIVFYIFLEKLKIKYSFYWTLIFLFSSPMFLFRMNLVRVPALSIVLSLLIILLLYFRKKWLLVLLGFLYVWLYGGFILAAMIFLLYFCFYYFVFKKIYWPSIYLLGGIMLGFLFHPYLKNLLLFLKIQLLETGPFTQIPVGMEWGSFNDYHFIKTSFLVLIIFIAGCCLLIVQVMEKFKNVTKEKRVLLITLFILSFLFFVLSIRSQRFIEYFVPFSLLFGIVLIDIYLRKVKFKKIKKNFNFVFGRLFLISFLVIIGFFNFQFIHRDLKTYNIEYAEGNREVSEWVVNNIAREKTIFNVDWSDFPLLFFYNDENYYISGLDPAFTYSFNKDLYNKWQMVSRGEVDIYEVVRNDFRSDYIISNIKFQDLNNKLEGDIRFEKVGDFKYSKVYKLKN